jgi:hypothetical protein
MMRASYSGLFKSCCGSSSRNEKMSLRLWVSCKDFKQTNEASVHKRHFNYRTSTIADFLSRTCRSYYLEFVPFRGIVELQAHKPSTLHWEVMTLLCFLNWLVLVHMICNSIEASHNLTRKRGVAMKHRRASLTADKRTSVVARR